AVALFLFPEAGAMLHMTQKQFGLWAAIAIHDTSSVVGAASRCGDEALRIATTVKLARSLWIIPVAVITALFFRQKVHEIKVPWFIGLFVAAMLVHTYLPALRPFTLLMAPAAKTGLTVTLFLIGAGLSREVLKNTGWKPLLQGTLTWIAISIASLLTVLFTS
ncbi:MAG: putative sulfate exporter family transporter, partial [Chlorobiaceae bacterium]|nr:putative sulfate exporter family transporter [Chlorobiaceae bacterium]